jgi:protein TonB
LFSALAVGLMVTLALFWLMQAMVMNNRQAFEKTDNLQMLEFIRLKRDEQLKIQTRKVEKKPQPPEQRSSPPTPDRQPTAVQPVAQLDLNMPDLGIPLAAGRFTGSVVAGLSVATGQGGGTLSTDLIPLVRIPPRYPMSAANRRIEGQVTVEFTITKTGTVADAIVVDAEPSGIFNRAALEAVGKWKFKPKVVAGQAIEQRAQQTLQFKLSK